MNRELAIACAVPVAMLMSAPSLAQGTAEGRPRNGDLKVGDAAPDFDLKRLDGKGTVKLSSFKGKQPVVLIFGSYT